MSIVERILTHIVPILIFTWLVYDRQRRQKAKDIFHQFMRWIETGERP